MFEPYAHPIGAQPPSDAIVRDAADQLRLTASYGYHMPSTATDSLLEGIAQKSERLLRTHKRASGGRKGSRRRRDDLLAQGIDPDTGFVLGLVEAGQKVEEALEDNADALRRSMTQRLRLRVR